MYYQKIWQCYAGRLAMASSCIFFLILSGCANQKIRSDADKSALWESHRNNVSAISDWELAGRMAVKLENEAWSASLFWKQTGDMFEIRIIAPLAQGSAIITGDSNEVNLKTSDNREFKNNDVQQIMNQNLGWSIPIGSLKYWIRGITSPENPDKTIIIDDNGRLDSIEADDWTVIFQRYNLTTRLALPSRIELTRPGTEIRVVINRWNVKS